MSPVLLVLVVAPYCGEVLSGSSPPLEIVLPWQFAFMCMLYGSGALLCREIARRLGLGMVGLIFLGCAYGVYEEGLVDRFWYFPDYWHISGVGEYSVVGDTNILLAVHLTAFHAGVSICLSVLFVEWVRPNSRDKAWVNTRGLVIAVLALASTPILYGEFSQAPPLVTLVFAVLAMVAFLALAFALGRYSVRRAARRTVRSDKTPRRGISLVCFLCVLAHWVIVYAVPSTHIIWPVGVAAAVAPIAIGVVLVPRLAVTGRFGVDAVRAGSGIVTFFVLLGLVVGINGRYDMILSALATAWGLWLLRKWSRRGDSPVQEA